MASTAHTSGDLVHRHGDCAVRLSRRMGVHWPFWAQKGKGFEKCVEPELPVLYRVAYRLSRDPDVAADLVGQTLFKAYRGWQSFDGAHLRSWLLKILKNEWGVMLRSNGHTRTDTGLEGEVDTVAPDDVWSDVVARADYRLVLAELSKLPEEYRLAVQLCDVEECSYQHAAEIMEVPLGTVRSRLFRGREMLRKRLIHSLTAGDGR